MGGGQALLGSIKPCSTRPHIVWTHVPLGRRATPIVHKPSHTPPPPSLPPLPPSPSPHTSPPLPPLRSAIAAPAPTRTSAGRRRWRSGRRRQRVGAGGGGRGLGVWLGCVVGVWGWLGGGVGARGRGSEGWEDRVGMLEKRVRVGARVRGTSTPLDLAGAAGAARAPPLTVRARPPPHHVLALPVHLPAAPPSNQQAAAPLLPPPSPPPPPGIIPSNYKLAPDGRPVSGGEGWGWGV